MTHAAELARAHAADAREELRNEGIAEHYRQMKEQAVTNREHQFALFCEHFSYSEYADEDAMIDAANPSGPTPLMEWDEANLHKKHFDGWLACYSHHIGENLDAPYGG